MAGSSPVLSTPALLWAAVSLETAACGAFIASVMLRDSSRSLVRAVTSRGSGMSAAEELSDCAGQAQLRDADRSAGRERRTSATSDLDACNTGFAPTVSPPAVFRTPLSLTECSPVPGQPGSVSGMTGSPHPA
jgi:hypothetical protein